GSAAVRGLAGASLAGDLSAEALAGAVRVAEAAGAGDRPAGARSRSARVASRIRNAARVDRGVQVPVIGHLGSRILTQEASHGSRARAGVAGVVVLAVHAG